ncbi:sigma-70 family RNA polymerase sigma factor [Streptomyces sp. NPDC019396]|uniref:sigma-70 family RNA polymerase sigma factor n=1 Tax=Streptomyces sp. NPDC019396 TaxID=3154687 RepID=UPI0033EB9DD8
MSVDGRDEPLGGMNGPGAGRPRHGHIPSQGGPGRPRAADPADAGRHTRKADSAVPPQRGARTGAGAGGAGGTASGIGLPPSDAELLQRLRDSGVNGRGDLSAYDELFRRHSKAVRRYARTCCRDEHTAEDLTAEVFARTLHAVRVGAGPEHAVRAYLLTAVRRVAADWARSTKREQLVADFADFVESAVLASPAAHPSHTPVPGPLAPLAPGADVRAMQAAEQSLAMRAFRSLPERWQAVLWHTAVEEESPGAVAPLFGLSANATAVLASRAREGLRQAYLQAHVSTALTAGGDCAQYADRLGAYARGRLRMRAERGLRKHLEECSRCRLAAGELEQVNAGIPAVVPVAVIGWLATGYSLKAAGIVAGGVAGAGVIGGAAGGSTAGGASGAGASGASGISGTAGSAAVAEGLAAPVRVGVLAVAAGAAATAALVWALSSSFSGPRPDALPEPEAKPPAAQPVVPEAIGPSRIPERPAAAEAPLPSQEPTPGPAARHEPATVPGPTATTSAPGPTAPPKAEPTPAPTPTPTTATPAPPAPPAPEPAVYHVNRLAYRTFGPHTEPEIRVGTGSWLWQRWGMSIDGARYGHGISVRARSSVAIDLNRSCDTFEALAGIDDATLAGGSVRFSVYGDGARLWQSPALRRGDAAVPVSIGIAGHGTVQLVVEPQSLVGSVAVADWALARISCP